MVAAVIAGGLIVRSLGPARPSEAVDAGTVAASAPLRLVALVEDAGVDLETGGALGSAVAVDAGLDAGIDAGVDAGTDAGVKRQPRPVKKKDAGSSNELGGFDDGIP